MRATMLASLTLAGTASAAGVVTNTGAVGLMPSASGSIIAFRTWEGGVGDLNGDGDTFDWVVRYYDVDTGTTTSTGAFGYEPSASGSILAFDTPETQLGGDVNGDGDTSDWIVRYHDTATGVTTTTGVVGSGSAAGGSIIAFQTEEKGVRQDLNGDGDTDDMVIQFYDTTTGTTTNTGAIGAYPKVSGSTIAFVTPEGYYYPGAQDLNGDGDTMDAVIRFYDTSTGTLTNTGVVGTDPSVSGSIIAFSTSETWVGQDLNGDGDTSDFVIRYYDTATSTLTNTGAVGYYPSVAGSIIAFHTDEYSVGQDLNGDGDTSDSVIGYYDMATGEVTNTQADGAYPSVSGSIIAFITNEVGQDLNGDGDANDSVIRYYTIQNRATIETIQTLIDALVTDGSIDNQGVAQPLTELLEQAQANIDRGKTTAAVNTLEAFTRFVDSQVGKHITSEAAQSLAESVQDFIGGL